MNTLNTIPIVWSGEIMKVFLGTGFAPHPETNDMIRSTHPEYSFKSSAGIEVALDWLRNTSV